MVMVLALMVFVVQFILKMGSENIIVSICCVTYNHKDFIEDCLNGFINQKTNFKFEIIIHDDASNDGTDKIIKEYYNENPSIIKPIFQIQNQYVERNINPLLKYVFPACKGKYIALCEGDDYWVDPFKLQKQVDIMEANINYVMCFTRYQRYFQDTNMFKLSGFNKSKVYYLKDFMYANHAATATILFKNIKINYKIMANSPFGDWVLYNLLLQKGDAYYINDVTAVYRRHSINSEFYNPLPYKKKLYEMNLIFLKIHGFKYLYIFLKNIFKLFFLNKLY